MPQPNKELWWKKRFNIEPTTIDDLDLDCDEQANLSGFQVVVLKNEPEAFIASQIAAARKEGKREAYEEVKKTLNLYYASRYAEPTPMEMFQALTQAIDQAITSLD